MNHLTVCHVWCNMTIPRSSRSLPRRAPPLAKLAGLCLAVLCSAAGANAAAAPPEAASEQPTQTEPTEATTQPKTAAQAAADNAAAEAPSATPTAPASRTPNAPLIRDEEAITPPPGPVAPPFARPYTRRSRRLLEAPQAPRGEARQGLLFSLGVGGGSQFTSTPGLGKATASSDLDLRLGYGFSDRLQMFVDFNGQSARYAYGQHTSMSTVTLRAQTVLLGDRRGNGLTLNGGIGLGSFNPDAGGDFGNDYAYPHGGRFYTDRPVGLVVAGGLSYDARLGRYLSLSPEIFATWMAVPNDDRRQDIATQIGLRLKLLWYLK